MVTFSFTVFISTVDIYDCLSWLQLQFAPFLVGLSLSLVSTRCGMHALRQNFVF